MKKSIIRSILILTIFFAVQALASAQSNVNVNVGTLGGNQQVTITYQVSVNGNLPQGLQHISNQGTVTGSNINPVLSDDPSSSAVGDDTRTAVGFTLPVQFLPSTGETPIWYIVFSSLALAALASFLSYMLLRKQMRPR